MLLDRNSSSRSYREIQFSKRRLETTSNLETFMASFELFENIFGGEEDVVWGSPPLHPSCNEGIYIDVRLSANFISLWERYASIHER